MEVEKIIRTSKKLTAQSKTAIHLALINQHIRAELNASLKYLDTNLQQFNILRILRGQNETPISLSELTERMVTKLSNTSRIVDKLVEKELVERCQCSNNRRAVDIRITKTGLIALTKMSEAVDNTEKKLFENFTQDELSSLNSLLDKF